MARHTSHYHTLTDMWLSTQSQSDSPTPKGHTSIDTFSMPDGFESYSLAIDDPFGTRCVEDPPALIA